MYFVAYGLESPHHHAWRGPLPEADDGPALPRRNLTGPTHIGVHLLGWRAWPVKYYIRA